MKTIFDDIDFVLKILIGLAVAVFLILSVLYVVSMTNNLRSKIDEMKTAIDDYKAEDAQSREMIRELKVLLDRKDEEIKAREKKIDGLKREKGDILEEYKKIKKEVLSAPPTELVIETREMIGHQGVEIMVSGDVEFVMPAFRLNVMELKKVGRLEFSLKKSDEIISEQDSLIIDFKEKDFIQEKRFKELSLSKDRCDETVDSLREDISKLNRSLFWKGVENIAIGAGLGIILGLIISK